MDLHYLAGIMPLKHCFAASRARTHLARPCLSIETFSFIDVGSLEIDLREALEQKDDREMQTR